MLLQQIGNDVILEMDFGLQGFDLLIFDMVLLLASSRGLGEGGVGVFKELLLPLIDLRWLQTQLITKVRDRDFVDQLPLHNSGILLVHPGSSRVARGWWIFGGMAVVSE